ncbi:unnamed protein product, partial [Ectocarpus sp. 12 AP-2014]
AGEDAALVVSALRERYKVLTSRLLPLLSDWIHTLGRVHFGDDDNSRLDSNHAGAGNTRREASGGESTAPATAGGGAERRACASLLSRCLAVRNSANALVSKFVELRIDEEGGRGASWSSSSSWSVAPTAKQTRLQIRMDSLRGKGSGGRN